MQQYWAATRWSGYLMAALLAASVTAAAGAGDTEQAQTDARTQAVRALLADWDRADTPGAAVSVTLDGVEVANVAVGQADLEQGVAVSASTVFHAASLSKQVTAFAILLLEQDGRLAIDAPLARYLPEAAVLGPLSLRQLLNHTSGLRDQWTLLAAAGWRSEDLVSDEQVLRLLLRQRGGNAAPGTAYQYTNSGYALLAEVVRRVSGQSLAAFCRERIFAPLGMEHSRFQDDLQPLLPHRASSYHRGGEGYLRDVLSYASAGPSGLQTTAADLGRWAANLEQPRLGGVALVQRLQEQGVLVDGTVNDYALGQERRRYHGLDTWSHGGRDAGYRSFLLRIPGQRFSVAVLANAAEFDSARVAFAIADLYLSARPDYQPSAPVPSRRPSRRQLAAYAGDYELFPGVIFHLDSDGRQLFFSSYGSAAREALPALSASSFQLNAQRDLAIEFAPGGAAPASGLRYRIGLHGSLPARRVQLQPFAATQVALDELVGDYYSDELDTRYELRIVDGRLLALHARRPGIVLNAYQPDTFASSEWFFQKLQFERDGQGRISGFRLSGAIAEDIGFRRAPAR